CRAAASLLAQPRPGAANRARVCRRGAAHRGSWPRVPVAGTVRRNAHPRRDRRCFALQSRMGECARQRLGPALGKPGRGVSDVDLSEVSRWLELAYPWDGRRDEVLHVASDLSWSGRTFRRAPNLGDIEPELLNYVAGLNHAGASGSYLAACSLRP